MAALVHTDADPLAENILREWCRLSDSTREAGANWYPRVISDLATEADADRVAGILASLSPRAHWATTVEWTMAVLEAHKRRDAEPPPVSTAANRQKAWRIARGEHPLDVLGGPKTRSFYRNLTGDYRAVTVDVWAARVAGVPTPTSTREYQRIVAAYRTAAAEAGTDPRTIQAAVWIAARGKAS